jgi:methenyltetrahydromethanopterin cyclohydrolase
MRRPLTRREGGGTEPGDVHEEVAMSGRSVQQVIVVVTGVLAAASVRVAVADAQRVPGPALLASQSAGWQSAADGLFVVPTHGDHGHGLTRATGASPSGRGG